MVGDTAWPAVRCVLRQADIAPQIARRVGVALQPDLGGTGQAMEEALGVGENSVHGSFPQFTTAWPRPRRQLRTMDSRVSPASKAPAAAPASAPTTAPPSASPASSAAPRAPP